ncbi:MAG: hypothetical protein UV50_C0009G0003 [Parcubacteria group bacterium GW2011_GWB1_42_9]|nr:MAG: hypothetical protein UV50_C0009G0003 [Parcubacteria group bacterium GW2011_GWB1_42_9]
MPDHPTQIKKIFLIASAVVVVAMISLAVVKERQNAKVIAGFDESLKLKATADQILSITDYSGGDPNGVVKYTYVTDQKVPPETYKVLKEDLSKRTANAQIFLKSVTPISKKLQKEEYVGKFYSGKPFYNDGKGWRQTGVATTTKIAFLTQTRPTLLAQTKRLLGTKVFADTFYSGAGDGYVQYGLTYDVNTWATVHDSATGDAYPTLTSVLVQGSKNSISAKWVIDRAFLPFDTSAISSDSSIASANLSVYVTAVSDGNNDGNDYINVVQTTQADSSTLVSADYNNTGTIEGATAVDLTTGFTINVYNTFTLDSTGLNWITVNNASSVCSATTGVTCLGLREGHDINNAQPSNLNMLLFSTSEEAGTSQDPYLTITYSSIQNPSLIVNSVSSGSAVKVNSVSSGNTIRVNSNQ